MSGPGLPCVHCGLCLDTCPTYRVLGTEADSPRGRIYLMEGIERGEIAFDAEAALHLSRCLGCLACESACPSGVSFGRRIEEFRPQLAERRDAGEMWKNVARRVYTSDRMVRTGQQMAGMLDRAGFGSARRKVPGLGLLPVAASDASAEVSPLRRSRMHQPLRARARAAVLTGCIGDRLMPGLNRDAVEVLQRNQIEIVEVVAQQCCGALSMHSGRVAEARELAGANAVSFGAADIDFVVTTAAGCGAMMRDYAHVLREPVSEREIRGALRDERQLTEPSGTEPGIGDVPLDADAERARDAAAERGAALAGKVRDISELLVEIGFEKPRKPLEVKGQVAYHDACHLLHASGISSAPRAVCEAAIGREIVDLGENAICCGSAGSYNVDHPLLSAELGRRKAELVLARKATVVAVGNVGCMLQISKAIAEAGLPTVVRHPVELLAEAYRQG